MSKPAAPRTASGSGWGVSLRYHGTTLKDLRLRGDRPLRAGEEPDCELVVPGLGGAVVLASGPVLARVPGLGGVVRRGGELVAYEAEEQLALAPGDHATLTLEAHPEITLELRREEFERIPLATLFHVRELARQLVLGAGLLAGLVLLSRQETPVSVLEVKGDPDAPDSALVRAMFVAAAEAPRVDLHRLDLHRIAPLPVPAPAPAPEPEPAVAPLPLLLAGAEPVPVPVAEVDAQPKRSRRRARDLDQKVLSARNVELGLDADDLSGLLATDEDGVVGGVLGQLGGVQGGVLEMDLLAELRADGPPLAEAGGGGLGEAPAEVVEPFEFAQLDANVEAAAPDDELVDVVMPVQVAEQVVPVPVAPVAPPLEGGVNSHEQAGVAVVHGVVDGVAAVAPAARCDDPSLTPRSQLDVVFVIDVSTTMTFMLDRIEQQIASIDAEARAQGLDAHYGLVVFVDDVSVSNAGQPYADLAELQRDLGRWRAFTASNRQVTSDLANLDWPENTLDALHAAATGFAWRPADTTLRMVVHATDDDFGEAPAIQSGQTVHHNYKDTVAALRAVEIRMFSFAAKIGGQCECLDVRRGLFTKFRGRPSLPDATGGAVFDIDEVASGKLNFAAAVAGAIKSGNCTRYPLSPFAGKK